jgi:mitogen-activated protein kinase kinase kinase
MNIRVRCYPVVGGHRRFDSAGGLHELPSMTWSTPRERIVQSIRERENELEQKLRERKQIGQIHQSMTATSAQTSSLDPMASLQIRTIDFPWRRGTRIGQGGAGVAFRAINSSNGSIVCMKEIQLSSIASRSLPSTYPEKLRRIAEEIDMIMRINHPNIVRYFGIEMYKVRSIDSPLEMFTAQSVSLCF